MCLKHSLFHFPRLANRAQRGHSTAVEKHERKTFAVLEHCCMECKNALRQEDEQHETRETNVYCRNGTSALWPRHSRTK